LVLANLKDIEPIGRGIFHFSSQRSLYEIGHVRSSKSAVLSDSRKVHYIINSQGLFDNIMGPTELNDNEWIA